MIEYFEEIDRNIVLTVNAWHSPAMDEFMWWISQRIIWIPFYLLLLYLAWRRLERKSFLVFLLCAIFTVVLADLISVQLFKEVFMRYRPSHHALLTDHLHFYRLPNGDFYKGGQYGFISSHAANFFSLSIFVGFSLRKYYQRLIFVLLGIAVLVSFSRLYQGVHYVTDLLGGAVVGALIGFLVYKLIYSKLIVRS
ncbi:MAG: phosphatase PAP2 family protein [Bacteroidota bacterium]|jgi:undecaprenyl-diphosphatase